MLEQRPFKAHQTNKRQRDWKRKEVTAENAEKDRTRYRERLQAVSAYLLLLGLLCVPLHSQYVCRRDADKHREQVAIAVTQQHTAERLRVVERARHLHVLLLVAADCHFD